MDFLDRLQNKKGFYKFFGIFVIVFYFCLIGIEIYLTKF